MTKEEKYKSLLPQVQGLLSGEPDSLANMANLAALLHQEMGFWWTGFYRVEGEELILGPFQGPIACTRIAYGRGVCGTAWKEKRTVVVPDVEQFPGHIACSAASRSEIVVPVWHKNKITAVLDIDSKELGTFDETDKHYLEKMASLVYGPQKDIWFAAGCFWGAQKFFKRIDGVDFTEVGFANGQTENPTYKEVYTDTTGHAECVHVRYNPDIVSLNKLTELFFKVIDPLSLNKQGEDEGTRYRTGVYYDNQQDAAVLSEVFSQVKDSLGVNEMPVELLPLSCFYPADEYHQDYLDKNPQAEAVHNLAHGVFPHLDVVFKGVLKGIGLHCAAIDVKVVEAKLRAGDVLAHFEAVLVVVRVPELVHILGKEGGGFGVVVNLCPGIYGPIWIYRL